MIAFLAQVIDKQTGSEFVLRVPATDEASCAARLFHLGFIVGRIEPAPGLLPDPEYRASAKQLRELADVMPELERNDGSGITPEGKVSSASRSDSLDLMIDALKWESPLIDRHFLLQSIVRIAYTVGNPTGASKVKAQSRTKPEEAWPMVERFGWQWVVEAETLRPHLKDDPTCADDEAIYLGITVIDDLRKHLKARGFTARAKEAEALEGVIFGHCDDDDANDPSD